jgi:DnaK suppressor protein
MEPGPYKARLEAELKDLNAASAETSAGRDPVALDQQSVGRHSRMDAMQVQEMAKETERRRRTRLSVIEAALARMAADDYGFCVSCDEEISAKRLVLDPAVATCIDCAHKLKG